MGRYDLNSADWGRIEAAMRSVLERLPQDANPEGKRAWLRTLDKIERINKTGAYTTPRIARYYEPDAWLGY